jgi:hypothetical protein
VLVAEFDSCTMKSSALLIVSIRSLRTACLSEAGLGLPLGVQTLSPACRVGLSLCRARAQLCRADVQTYCFGLAASMGAFLLGAGVKGKRYSMPNARIMIHQPLGGASGQVRPRAPCRADEAGVDKDPVPERGARMGPAGVRVPRPDACIMSRPPLGGAGGQERRRALAMRMIPGQAYTERHAAVRELQFWWVSYKSVAPDSVTRGHLCRALHIFESPWVHNTPLSFSCQAEATIVRTPALRALLWVHLLGSAAARRR